MTCPEGATRLLDHGYLVSIDTWGSDAFIVETARVSTQGGFKGWGPIVGTDPCSVCRGLGIVDDRGSALTGQPYFDTQTCPTCAGDRLNRLPGDEKLLRYLYENKHSTPFEFAGLTIEIQAPIFVFREWHRHRTQSYSEASARYAPLPDLNYIPSVERIMQAGGANRQAGAVKGATALSPAAASLFRDALIQAYTEDERTYQKALADGVPKELARLVLPVGRYSRMRATANLRNWLQFLTLRSAPNAQWEIRQYADALGGVLRDRFPRTMALFDESGGP